MLGVCLKRYAVSADGTTSLVKKYIDIPLEASFPHFAYDGSEDDGWGSSFFNFKVSLLAVICHRGNSVHAGHYVSLVRPASNENQEGNSDIEPRFRWLLSVFFMVKR